MDSLLTAVYSCDGVIGKVKDFFLRDEFQQRGSPHSHWLTFNENAPVYGKQSNQEICDYVTIGFNVVAIRISTRS
jgi:hypothetical protein